MKIVLLTVKQLFRKEPAPIEDTMNIQRTREAAERERASAE